MRDVLSPGPGYNILEGSLALLDSFPVDDGTLRLLI